jgi:hypothetical protein
MKELIMMRHLALGLAVAALLAASAGAADAKIYIPCTGDRLVTVKEVPKAKQVPGGPVLHLGYKFPGCFGDGEWVGTTDESKKYYSLNPTQLKALAERAGFSAVPPTPSRFQYPFDALLVEILTALVVGGVLVWELIKRRRSTGTQT